VKVGIKLKEGLGWVWGVISRAGASKAGDADGQSVSGSEQIVAAGEICVSSG
jgi:hypothetical protein